MKYVIAFDKFTIPDEKVFRIEINEKNGGRAFF
ncbi:conjugative transposon protein TraN (plasmid) [Bacteroides faecis]|nr:conjugative transposon protein TraN [Bacteroides faecis]MCS3305842.1 conjugative transposon protein TraN [Bacteroides faecis]